MDFTETQKKVYYHWMKQDFIPAKVLEDLSAKLESERNEHTMLAIWDKFYSSQCPKCGASGAFKWHFLGKVLMSLVI